MCVGEPHVLLSKLNVRNRHGHMRAARPPCLGQLSHWRALAPIDIALACRALAQAQAQRTVLLCHARLSPSMAQVDGASETRLADLTLPNSLSNSDSLHNLISTGDLQRLLEMQRSGGSSMARLDERSIVRSRSARNSFPVTPPIEPVPTPHARCAEARCVFLQNVHRACSRSTGCRARRWSAG